MRSPRLIALAASLVWFGALSAQEICNNGIDDDGDGLTDLNDTQDCVCQQAIIPNPSFESMNCCPPSLGSSNCVQSWENGNSIGTVDYFNNCGWIPPIMPLPLPNGNGILGGFAVNGLQEYIGTCLTNPMLNGVAYSLSLQVAAAAVDGASVSSAAPIFFPPFDLAIFGLSSCSLPAAGSGCPTGAGWTQLATFTYNPMNAWSTATFNFVAPFDVQAIMIGSQCGLPPAFTWNAGFGPYLFYDAISLNGSSSSFGSQVVSTGSVCNGDLELIAHPDTVTGIYQWFYEGYAIVGLTDTIFPAGLFGFGDGTYQFMLTLPNGVDCAVDAITIAPPNFPTVDFTANPVSGCAPLQVQFTNTTTPLAAIGQCTWDFGDGSPPSNAVSPLHTYTNPGLYSVQLTVISPDNCYGSVYYQDLIDVGVPPTASFTLDVTQGCGPLTVNFTNTSPGAIQGCTWNIGTGPPVNQCNFSYTYTAVGTYPVTLTVSSPQGCVSQPAGPVDVVVTDLTPQVAFSANATSGCAPFQVQFTNNTTPAGAIGQCTWDFGDGTTSNTVSPSHTYTTAGLYTVQLSVLSPTGQCSGSASQVDMISVDAAPTATFTIDTLEGCAPLTVTFISTTAPPVAGYNWNIGTGTPVYQGSFTHVYAAAGTYPVSLVVTSPNGCPSPPAGPLEITVNPLPNVQFTSNVTDGCAPAQVEFTNTTNPALIGSCQWDLGNGVQTTDCDPVADYPVPGNYDISLTVTSPLGCAATLAMPQMISIYAIPLPYFLVSVDSGCYPLEVQFTNLTDTNTVASYFWEFGDGATSADQDPMHTYTTGGVMDVTLSVTSPQGCTGDTTFTDLIDVFEHPVADFTYEPQPTDVFETTIQFTDGSTDDVVTWEWEFGVNGAVGDSDEPDPRIFFPDQNPGSYPTTLIVTNHHGCKDTTEAVVVIDPYFSVYVPNAFTPDGDGINDYFYPLIKDDDPKYYKLYIYDRWGAKVFESTDRYNVWAGSYMNQSSEILPQGVYAWKLITAPNTTKLTKEFVGHVTLLK